MKLLPAAFVLLGLLLPPPAAAQQMLLLQFPYVPAEPAPIWPDLRDAVADFPVVAIRNEDFQVPETLQFSDEELPWVRRLQQGFSALQSGNHEEARSHLAAFLRQHPDYIPARVALADLFLTMGQHAEAAPQYQRVLSQDPLNFHALNNLAWLKVNTEDPALQDPQGALVLIQRGLMVASESHHPWSTLSQVYFALGRFREAAEAGERAMRIAERSQVSPQVLVNYLNQVERARQALQATSFLD